MALKRRCPNIGPLHHSDQGCTYASEDHRRLLAARGIICSMSRRGNCYDNAVMEAFFSTVKSELGERFDSNGDAKMQLFRLHRSVLQPTTSSLVCRSRQSGGMRAACGITQGEECR
jgi:transposase InsO family protein